MATPKDRYLKLKVDNFLPRNLKTDTNRVYQGDNPDTNEAGQKKNIADLADKIRPYTSNFRPFSVESRGLTASDHLVRPRNSDTAKYRQMVPLAGDSPQ